MIQLIKRKYAFSLLEIMLALSVVAIVTILAVRYYSSSAQSQRIQNAVDQINAVRGAMQNAVVGSNVNLGNIAPFEVIPLECLRLGLRGDTFFETLPQEIVAEFK